MDDGTTAADMTPEEAVEFVHDNGYGIGAHSVGRGGPWHATVYSLRDGLPAGELPSCATWDDVRLAAAAWVEQSLQRG
jgi:hypothetical protein